MEIQRLFCGGEFQDTARRKRDLCRYAQPAGQNGGYRDVAKPITKEFRSQLNEAVVEAYTTELDHLQARLAAATEARNAPPSRNSSPPGAKQAEQAQAEKPAKAKASRGRTDNLGPWWPEVKGRRRMPMTHRKQAYDAACYYDGKLLGRCTVADSEAYSLLMKSAAGGRPCPAGISLPVPGAESHSGKAALMQADRQRTGGMFHEPESSPWGKVQTCDTLCPGCSCEHGQPRRDNGGKGKWPPSCLLRLKMRFPEERLHLF